MAEEKTKKLPAVLEFIKNNTIKKSAEKYTGSTLFK